MNHHQEEEEEEDYMSSAFLEQATEYEKKTQQKTYSERRRDQLREQQKKAYIKPRKQLEEEAREEGLKKEVDQNNKGFKMLMKMGYKQGSTLGNSQQGIQEPISVEIKKDRIGLGLQSMMKRKRENEDEEARKKLDQEPELFREAMAEKRKLARRIREITAAVNICEKLDSDHDVEKNILWCLLPKKEEEKEHDDGIDDDDIQEADNENNEDVFSLNEKKFPKEEIEDFKSLKLDEQLDKLVEYLRLKYTYCFWCAAKYDNKEDLEANCPGPTEDDH